MATYEPTAIPSEYGALRSWLATQFRRVADALSHPTVDGVHFAILTAEPARFDDGEVIFADGTFWNPGGGRGLYQRTGGAWVKL